MRSRLFDEAWEAVQLPGGDPLLQPQRLVLGEDGEGVGVREAEGGGLHAEVPIRRACGVTLRLYFAV